MNQFQLGLFHLKMSDNNEVFLKSRERIKEINCLIQEIFKKQEKNTKNVVKSSKRYVLFPYIKEIKEQLDKLSGYLCLLRFKQEQNPSIFYNNFLKYFVENLSENLQKLEHFLKQKKKTWTCGTICGFTVRFHHIYQELKAFYPENKFESTISFGKEAAKNWWNLKIGNSPVILYEKFFIHLTKDFKEFSQHRPRLHESLSFSSDKYITKYSFDIFTRLFGPWNKMIDVWLTLINHPGYLKNGTFQYIVENLEKNKTKLGSYFFRISMSNNGCWSIGYINNDSKIVQVICFGLPIADTLACGCSRRLYVYPGGSQNNVDMKMITNLSTVITVDRNLLDSDANEEATIICQICKFNRNNIQIEPCAHISCNICIKKSLSSRSFKSANPPCPFCRMPILSTSLINIVFKEEYYTNEIENIHAKTDFINPGPHFNNNEIAVPTNLMPTNATNMQHCFQQSKYQDTNNYYMRHSSPIPELNKVVTDSNVNGAYNYVEVVDNKENSNERNPSPSCQDDENRQQRLHVIAQNKVVNNNGNSNENSPSSSCQEDGYLQQQLHVIAQTNVVNNNGNSNEDSPSCQEDGNLKQRLHVIAQNKIVNNSGNSNENSPISRSQEDRNLQQRLRVIAQNKGELYSVLSTFVRSLSQFYDTQTIIVALEMTNGDMQECKKLLEPIS